MKVQITVRDPKDRERFAAEREHNRNLGELTSVGWGRTWVPSKYLLVDRETGDVWGFDDEGGTRRVQVEVIEDDE